ncbi:hypothetical protein KC19_8G021900 [Ceratodon purpureus]|uniref:Uncharacterized protein n=1 Tax=Ceratodon purpureus TaxID=3225 RepID=A0A8T0GY06_CERPU|nr:hypothetical protein KC19_8G021900 [Ceratodon purpureus]
MGTRHLRSYQVSHAEISCINLTGNYLFKVRVKLPELGSMCPTTLFTEVVSFQGAALCYKIEFIHNLFIGRWTQIVNSNDEDSDHSEKRCSSKVEAIKEPIFRLIQGRGTIGGELKQS